MIGDNYSYGFEKTVRFECESKQIREVESMLNDVLNDIKAHVCKVGAAEPFITKYEIAVSIKWG